MGLGQPFDIDPESGAPLETDGEFGLDTYQEGDDSASGGSLTSKILGTGGQVLSDLGSAGQGSSASNPGLPGPGAPSPYTPQGSALEPMGTAEIPQTARNPRLQSALLEA